MKSGEWRLAAIGITLLGAGAVGTRLSQGAMRDAVLPGGCRTPVRVLAPRAPQAVGSAVVFHGLPPSGRMMQTLGQWLAALGLQVYLVDSPGTAGATNPFPFRAQKSAPQIWLTRWPAAARSTSAVRCLSDIPWEAASPSASQTASPPRQPSRFPPHRWYDPQGCLPFWCRMNCRGECRSTCWFLSAAGSRGGPTKRHRL